MEKMTTEMAMRMIFTDITSWTMVLSHGQKARENSLTQAMELTARERLPL